MADHGRPISQSLVIVGDDKALLPLQFASESLMERPDHPNIFLKNWA